MAQDDQVALPLEEAVRDRIERGEDVILGDQAEPPSPHLKPYELSIAHWPIRDLDDAGLEALSKEKDLFLNVVEMRTIQEYFRRLGREPTIEETAKASETCVDEARRVLAMSRYPISLDRPVGNSEDSHFGDLLPDGGATREEWDALYAAALDDFAGVCEQALGDSSTAALMRNRAGNFSVGRLMEFLTSLGQDVRITVKPTRKRVGEMEVVVS